MEPVKRRVSISEEEIEERKLELRRLAAKEGKHMLLEQFSPEFLRHFVSQMKPQIAWKSFLSMEASRERIRKAESDMSLSHFAEKIRSGESEVRGWTMDLRPILWYRIPSGVSEYKVGTPQFEALLRYTVYIFELLTMRIGEDFGDAVIIVDDDARTRFAEASMEVLREIFKILRDTFPVPNARVYILNSARSISNTWKIALTVLPPEFTSRCSFFDDLEFVFQFVSNRNDIPPWWFKNKASDFEATYDTVWDYRRCMTRGAKALSLKDVFCDKTWRRKNVEERN